MSDNFLNARLVAPTLLCLQNNNQVTCQERLTFARDHGYVTLLDGAVNFEKNYTTNVQGEAVVSIIASTNIVQSVERFWTMALINTVRK